jgi:hypothetical protein
MRLSSAISELSALFELLHSDDLEQWVLGDFRDTLNRVRNTAWAAQQAAANKLFEHGPTDLDSLLASSGCERPISFASRYRQISKATISSSKRAS